MHLPLILLALVTGASSLNIFPKLQSVEIQGTLKCSHASNSTVNLMEEDWASPDDKLNTTTLDMANDAHFILGGGDTESGTIDTYLSIEHECNDKGEKKELKVTLPKEALFEDGNHKICDIGEIDLSTSVDPVVISKCGIEVPFTTTALPSTTADLPSPTPAQPVVEAVGEVEEHAVPLTQGIKKLLR